MVIIALKKEEGNKTKNSGSPRSWKIQENGFLLEPPERYGALVLPIAASPFGIFDLQIHKRVNLCYIKPLSWWQFVAATIGN